MNTVKKHFCAWPHELAQEGGPKAQLISNDLADFKDRLSATPPDRAIMLVKTGAKTTLQYWLDEQMFAPRLSKLALQNFSMMT